MSLPGLTLTRNKANTGRWSEVLITGQEEYLTAWMSSLYRLRYTTRSWEAEREGTLTVTPWKEALAHRRHIHPFSTLHCVKLGVLDRDAFLKKVCLIPTAALCRALSTGAGCKGGKVTLAACVKLTLSDPFFQTSSTCPVALKQQISPQQQIPARLSHAAQLWKAAFSRW